ncbi:MAG: DNA replication/repair protein RecF [Gemmatimonadaceae bacterium]
MKPESSDGAAVAVTNLSVQGFRNLAAAKLEIPRSGAVLIGENGHGKTNFLEALYYLHLLRSFRGAMDVDVVSFGEESFHLGASVGAGPASANISVGFESTSRRKKAMIDGKKPPRLSDAFGHVPTVMFSPRDAQLVSGGPSERRRYLDIMLAATSRKYLHALHSYRTALQQRNSALRGAMRGSANEAEAEVWEPAMAEHGAVLIDTRASWAELRAGEFGALCTAIGESDGTTLRYRSRQSGSGDTRAALAASLAEHRAIDLRRGITHAGPHRDDLVLELGGREMREFASAGQQRTGAIALRMLEAATLHGSCGARPVLLLDDPFAELDSRRSAAILALLSDSGFGQTFLCVPKAEEIPRELSSVERWSIRSGVIAR